MILFILINYGYAYMLYLPQATQVPNDGVYSQIKTLSHPSHERSIIFCCHFREKGKTYKGTYIACLKNLSKGRFHINYISYPFQFNNIGNTFFSQSKSYLLFLRVPELDVINFFLCK